MSDLIDANEIIRALNAWFRPEDVFEVRVLDAVTRAYFRPHIESGYFDGNHIKDVPAALSHIKSAKGFYVTVNPVKPELLNRAVNRVRPAGREPTTTDADILCRRWLLIDCDAKRSSGIPSSDAEHLKAQQKAMEIQQGFASMGWNDPFVLDSGNGAQLMYRIDVPTADCGLVQRVLQSVAAVSSDAVDIDLTVHNPARIWRLPGTMNCKGDSTEERPHRFSRLVSIPFISKVLTVSDLQSACRYVPEQETVSHDFVGDSNFDLDTWINTHCHNISAPRTWKGGRKWVFEVCPFNPDHTDKSAVITQQANGAIGFTCHHNGCQGNDWHKLRELLEPERPLHIEHHDVDLSEFFEKIKDKKARKENPFDDPGALPDDLLSVPGLINDIMRLDLSTAPYPNKTLAFCGALCFVAHLAGRRFRDRRNNFTNIYLVALANSGTGKDHPRKVNNDLGALSGITDTISDSFASGAGLEDAMYVTPAQLFQMDEVDWLFNTLKGSKDASVSESINEKLLKFYSSSNSVYYMRKKAFAQKQTLAATHDNGFISNPCLNLFGTAVPDYFYESLSRRVLENGLIARCSIVEADKRGRRGTPSVIRDAISPNLLEKINAIVNRDVPQTPLGVPLPFEVAETPEATELLNSYCDECDSRYDGFEKLHDLAAMALWARAMEKVFKLSMVYAISADAVNPIITEDAVRWAFKFVTHVTRQMLFRAGQFCYDSKSDQLQKRFLKRLHESGGDMRHSDMMRVLHLSRSEMREVVDTLLDAKLIDRVVIEERGKSTVFYHEVGV